MAERQMKLLRKYGAHIRRTGKRPEFEVDLKAIRVGDRALKKWWRALPHKARGDARKEMLRAIS